MNAKQVLKLFQKAGKRASLIGSLEAGAIAALDLEGRLFAVLDGQVLNRVNPEAITGQSTREKWLNPGGDGLWAAPEGTSLGFQYATGAWRVSPGLVAARFQIAQANENNATIRAEIDLVNGRGLGVPTIFQRRISIKPGKNSVTLNIVESITYTGCKELRRSECLLAPWSLCQFDCGPGCGVVFPAASKSSVWDLYDEPSDAQREWAGQMCRTRTVGSQRYQIGIDAKTPWIEYQDPRRGLTVRRKSGPLPEGQTHIDFRDAPPDVSPSKKGIRYSVYGDPSMFMEIEAAGGSPAVIRPNAEMTVAISTRYQMKQ
jgi:hypothetical protein